MADVDTVALQDAIGALIETTAGGSPALGLDALTAVMAARDRDAGYPYLVFGGEEILDRRTDCGDAVRAFLPLHVWTKESGRTQCKTICGGLRELLDEQEASLSVAGHLVSAVFHRRTRILDDPAISVRHGIVEFEIDIARIS